MFFTKSNINKIVIVSFFTLTFAGCNSLKPALYSKSPEFIEIGSDKDELLEVDYIARYMMSADERLELEAHMNKVEVKRESSGNGATGIGLASTIMLGNNPLSNSGVSTAGRVSLGVDAAFIAYSVFGPDGSADHISKIYLPHIEVGKALSEVEEASKYAKSYTAQRIKLFAENEGRIFSCIYGCEGKASIYRLTKKGFTGAETYDVSRRGTEIPEGEYYDPPVLYVRLNGAELKKSRSDPLRDRILGFTPYWESRYPNGWQVVLGTDFKRDQRGNIIFVNNKIFGKTPKKMLLPTENTPLARRFLRTLTGGDNLIYRGNSDYVAKSFAMKGKVYSFVLRWFKSFILFEISPMTDLVVK